MPKATLAGLCLLSLLLCPLAALAETGGLPPLSGTVTDIRTFKDALGKYKPSKDESYRFDPPPADRAREQEYFLWRGVITAIQEAEGPTSSRRGQRWGGIQKLKGVDPQVYLCLESEGGFAFREVQKSFTSLRMGAEVEVLGRYAGNLTVEMPDRQVLLIPVLTVCFVR